MSVSLSRAHTSGIQPEFQPYSSPEPSQGWHDGHDACHRAEERKAGKGGWVRCFPEDPTKSNRGVHIYIGFEDCSGGISWDLDWARWAEKSVLFAFRHEGHPCLS